MPGARLVRVMCGKGYLVYCYLLDKIMKPWLYLEMMACEQARNICQIFDLKIVNFGAFCDI